MSHIVIGVALLILAVPFLIDRICLLCGESLIHDPDQHTGEPN